MSSLRPDCVSGASVRRELESAVFWLAPRAPGGAHAVHPTFAAHDPRADGHAVLGASSDLALMALHSQVRVAVWSTSSTLATVADTRMSANSQQIRPSTSNWRGTLQRRSSSARFPTMPCTPHGTYSVTRGNWSQELWGGPPHPGQRAGVG